MSLSKAQTNLVELLESSMGDSIDGIGQPTLDEQDRIKVEFQYGNEVYEATIDPDAGTIAY
jgi:hypothetical protein